MKFFGDVDKNAKGNVASEYPAFYFTKQKADLKENIEQIERSIKSGRIPPDEIPEHRLQQEVYKERLEAIDKATPRPNDNERNMLFKHYKSLAVKIEETMFTLSDMKRGMADAHVEAERMVQPCIALTPEEEELALECNVKVIGHKVSRNGASKIFKIIGKMIGEPTNIEVLRKDTKTDAFIPTEIGRVKPLREELLTPEIRQELKNELKQELLNDLKSEQSKEVKTTKTGKPDKRFKT